MSDHPILFSAPMVRAILEGRKTQTRRVLKLPTKGVYERPDMGGWAPTTIGGNGTHLGDGRPAPEMAAMWHQTTGHCVAAPVQFGDRLWVREAWRTAKAMNALSGKAIGDQSIEAGYQQPWAPILYEADRMRLNWNRGEHDQPGRYRHGRFMPRWASRITLTVTDVRVQRLQEISEEDAVAEGIMRSPHGNGDQWCDYPLGSSAAGWTSSRDSFRSLWNSINGPDAWDANPWIAAYTFRPVFANIDSVEKEAA